MWNTALKNDGTVWTFWRYDIDWNRVLQPAAQVQGLNNVTAIAWNTALRNDSTVWAWDGDLRNTGIPLSAVQLQGLSNIITLTPDAAIKSDGTVWTWDWDWRNTGLPFPATQVPNLSDVIAVSATAHTVALRSDGTVWARGRNCYGQLGNGTISPYGTPPTITPTQVLGPNGIGHLNLLEPIPLFLDVPANHWARPYILTAADRDFVGGRWCSNANRYIFAPDDNFTRAEAAQVLWNMENRPAPQSTAPFTDTAAHWAAPAIAWAAENRIVFGRPNHDGTHRFDPDDSMTRQEFFAIKQRFAGELHGIDTRPGIGPSWPFPDHDQIHGWAVNAVQWAHYAGLSHGDDAGNVNPQGRINRAEAAALIVRFDDADLPLAVPVEPEPLNIQPLLGMPINEVRHLFGNVVRTDGYDGNGIFRLYEFDTNIIIDVHNGLLASIRVRFGEGTTRAQFHYNGLDGYVSRANVRAALGVPYQERGSSEFGWWYTYRSSGAYLCFDFDLDGELRLISFSISRG